MGHLRYCDARNADMDVQLKQCHLLDYPHITHIQGRLPSSDKSVTCFYCASASRLGHILMPLLIEGSLLLIKLEHVTLAREQTIDTLEFEPFSLGGRKEYM